MFRKLNKFIPRFLFSCFLVLCFPCCTKPSQAHILHVAGLDPQVARLALKAHSKATAEGVIENPNVLTIIDFSKPSYEKRMWVIDVSSQQVLYHSLVAHGSHSGSVYAKSFSNQPGSHQSSLGVFKTGSIYMGNHGRSLNMHGLEPGVNSNAYNRRIVIHSAHYVSESLAKNRGMIGRSHGCPALPPQIAPSIIQSIKGGTMMFVYYPDKQWLKQSRFV